MKKIIALILALVLVMALSACSKVEITMQDIVDANKAEALLKNHKSVHIRESMDGEFFGEKYLTKDYIYNYIPSNEADWLEFITDEACYYYVGKDYAHYVFISPDGVGDFKSTRAERTKLTEMAADAADQTIESVSKKDGRIIVKTFLDQETLAEQDDEFPLTSAKFEYVLDAKTREIISLTSNYIYEDGEAISVFAEVIYDAEAPEQVKTILGYENQTENLRNVTVVNNPGTDKEETKTIQVPKGLIIGLEFDDAYAETVAFYTDADCTQSYDPFAGTDSDLTIYVKWAE